MWGWTRDQRICNAFGKLTVLEAVALVIFVAGDVVLDLCAHRIALLHTAFEAFTWMVIGMLVFSRFQILYSAFFIPRTSLKVFSSVDRRMYYMLFCAILLYVLMVLLMPDSVAALVTPARSMVQYVSFLLGAFNIFKEEISYRLLLYYALHRLAGRNTAFFGTVVLFALHHSFNPYYPVAVLPASIALSLVTLLSGSIFPSLLLHAILNLLVYLGIVVLRMFGT